MSRPESSAVAEIRRSWRVLIAAMLGLGLSGGASLYWFGIMVGPLSHRFGWTTSELSGWALIVHVTTYLLGPASGLLIDRVGARTMALWSIPVVVAGFTGVGIGLHALWMLYLGAFVIGASNSCFTLFTRAINTWFVAGRGIALGIAYSGAGITSILGPRVTLWVVDSFGWHAGFVFMGFLTLLPLPAAYFWLRERRFEESPPSVKAAKGGSEAPNLESGLAMGKALRLPAFWCIGGGCLLYFLAYNGIQFGLIPLLTEEGLSRAAAADYAGLMGVFILVGKLASGLAFDRFRMAFALAGFLFVDAFALVALGFFHRTGAAAGLIVIGFTQGAMMSGFPYAVARYFGVRFFAGISGLISLLLSLSALGALLFSRFHDVFGSYHVSLVAASALLLLASLLFRLLGRRPYFASDDAASASIPLRSSSPIRSTS